MSAKGIIGAALLTGAALAPAAVLNGSVLERECEGQLRAGCQGLPPPQEHIDRDGPHGPPLTESQSVMMNPTGPAPPPANSTIMPGTGPMNFVSGAPQTYQDVQPNLTTLPSGKASMTATLS